MPNESVGRREALVGDLNLYPLIDALIGRRSRRFALGMRLNGGPLAYESAHPAEPLSEEEEEAVLAFAACGLTGYALAELPYEPGNVPEGGGGNIMTHFVARTAASGDAMHNQAVFVLADDGAWLLRRPQDYPRGEIAALIQAAQERQLVELYQRARVRLAERRPDVPREVPFHAPFNKYSANVAGATYFLPVAECTSLYINILLSMFDPEFAYFVVDERNGFQPAGLAGFGRSVGGSLHDDPRDGRFATVGGVEVWLHEFQAVEQGGILQNLGLMTQALGLGGFTHFAAHPFGWLQALGFRLEAVPFSRLAGTPPDQAAATEGSEELQVPTAVGLEREGQVLLKPFCPPYYRDMEQAVLAFIDYKYARGQGTFRDGGLASGWLDGARVQAGIPRYSDRSIEATIAYCDYVYRRYGRFPSTSGPFRTLLAYQAHHLDLEFYDRFYRPETISETQRQHARRWHDTVPA
jgi:hypothetical protein